VDTNSSWCTAGTSFFARTPTRSFTSSKVKRTRQVSYKRTTSKLEGRLKSRPHFLSQSLRDFIIVLAGKLPRTGGDKGYFAPSRCWPPVNIAQFSNLLSCAHASSGRAWVGQSGYDDHRKR
jgi:hypothetical protein